MKTINDFINIFEKYVQGKNEKAVIVLHTEVLPCKFNAYKEVRYSLHCINRETGSKHELVSLGRTARILKDEDLDKIYKEIEEELVLWIFDFIKERL